MKYFEIFIDGKRQKLPFVGIKREHQFAKNVRKKDQSYLFSGERIDYANGKSFETLEVLWEGNVRQLENDTLIDENGEYNFVDFRYDWKDLLKQNGLCIVKKLSPVLLCKNVNPEDVLSIEEYGRYFLPEMEKKGKPIVIFDLIKSKFMAIGENEFLSKYKEKDNFNRSDVSLYVLRNEEYLFITSSNDINAIYLVDGELVKDDYYISMISASEQELRLRSEINAFCYLPNLDLEFLNERIDFKEVIQNYETVAWVRSPIYGPLEKIFIPAHDVNREEVFDLMPSFIKEILQEKILSF